VEFNDTATFKSFLWCSNGKRKREDELHVEVDDIGLTLGFGGTKVELFQTGVVTSKG
jgi:hypothetical protein